ncbi:hypothetical protein Lbir_3116 [Legionella birminghamensis]|uniref:Uncharacterized protein n=1 Tax=Legionella birminghamensis TaxID=28083 RepID=A0A378ILR3_9GAMM|nr:hypothetical protein [Legionella birminghamensis]KTC66814.1 hypothetical protein Lbir_3116 [Legionella birminghamensis]STX33054.1 Uncharacterised protein [Legionella birminghamensis]
MANKRLVWNFEIDSDGLIDFSALASEEPDILRWEIRYFWPADSFITLYGLGEAFLDLSRYQIKQRVDVYHLLNDGYYNIKDRRDELLYKPMIEERGGCQGFGHKINLLTQSPGELLLGEPALTVREMLSKIEQESRMIRVDKVALKYKLPLAPAIKLELAKIRIADQGFFSVCIEGRSHQLVTRVSQLLMRQHIPCDYVRFLKQTHFHE